jgi:hypothetical protein
MYKLYIEIREKKIDFKGTSKLRLQH